MDKKMTFGDLEELIEHWTTDLQDFQSNFFTQSSEIEKAFWRIESNDTKFKLVETKLGVLHYMHKQAEEGILKASIIQQNMEQAVAQLETLLIALEGAVPIDPVKEVYGFAANINLGLENLKNETELLSKAVKCKEKEILKDPLEQLAKTMMKLLEILVHIETKIKNMKNSMRWIEGEYKLILHKGHN